MDLFLGILGAKGTVPGWHLSAAGDASFLRSSSGEGVSELVLEFPAVLGVFLRKALHERHAWKTLNHEQTGVSEFS